MLYLQHDNMELDRFHVICMISNPIRFESRYRLYRQFAQHMADCGIQLWTVEVAFGNRPHEVTEAGNPYHLQLRSEFELWHKENAMKLMVQRLPITWRYMAWIDADIDFKYWHGRKAWYLETLQQLQHYQIVQLFSQAIDMGPNGEAMQMHQGFAYMYVNNKPYGTRLGYTHWHPGFAWAIRREAYDAMGGFIDFAILGAGDNHMAHGIIGRVKDSVNGQMQKPYIDRLKEFENKAVRYLRKRMGYVPGIINHYFHGKKKDRRYQDRWQILVKNKFNPDTDIMRDYQGLWQLVDHGNDRSIKLRDDIMKYFRARNEDSIDTE